MTRFRLLAASAVFALAAFGALTPVSAAIVVNGSFEANTFNASGGNYTLGLSGNAVTGWFIPAGDGVYPWGLRNGNSFGAGPAADGLQWIVLGEQGNAAQYTIQQTLHGLAAGSTYALSFALASEQGCCAVAQVSFLAGSSTPAQNFTAPTNGPTFWGQWGAFSENFIATASDVTLQFKDINPTSNGYDVGLDNVSVVGTTAAVPEPVSLALLGLGLAGLAAVRTRKNR